jgi:ketosteroid isomerase-like protein
MTLDTPGAVLEAYTAAVHDRSADALLGLYAADSRVFDTWGTWSYEGTGSRRPAIEGWFSSLGDERVRVAFDDVQVIIEGELAVLTATGRYAAVSPSGTELRSMENRFTWALVRRGQAWVIQHEHTSAPIGPGDLKAILRRAGA